LKKYEILAPAGELKAISPLIEAGSNAIYVGLDGFSSRPRSSDLSIKEIESALQICHQNDVRLHIAINGCISEDNLDKVYDKLKILDRVGADAVIIADWGILSKASLFMKNTELHASTLLGTYNSHTIRYLRDMGINRVVLSTNLYIDEIASIINSVPDIEYEMVADGGICFNDNRICELPHVNDGADYTVFCRKPYVLYYNNSTVTANRIAAKQISSAEIIDLYLELGVTSFKIEGRTVDYHYIVPKVKKIKQAIEEASLRKHSISSTLHYVAERRRTVEDL